MMDIVSVGQDIGLYDTQTPRAANILSVQLRSLTYASDLGIDLEFFLSEDFVFQNESFRSYLIQVLANRSINVASVTTTVENLLNRYQFDITPSEQDSSMVAR